LADRIGLVIAAASELGATPELFGLGAYEVVSGPSVLSAGVIVADDLGAKQRAVLKRWSRDHCIETPSGRRRWRVVTLSEFFDPRTGPFVQNAYSGAGWVIGADLGRIFGLAAEHAGTRLGKNADAFQVWLPGWGKEHERGRWMRGSPHRPPLWIEARRVGWRVAFGPSAKQCGKYVDGRQWRGAFLDVLSLAYALDADRGASFSEHRENFGLSPLELPVAVALDKSGVAAVTDAVVAVHELVVALDENAARWFTTSLDRAEERGRLDLARTVSPGGIAAQIPLRCAVTAPITTFDQSDREHRASAETVHGGRCDADARLLGIPFEAATADVSSCFPLDANRIGWWDLLCADRIGRRKVTAPLRRFCERLAKDPYLALDPQVWRVFGCCLVEIVPDGETLPIEVEDERRPDGRLETVPVSSPDRPLFYMALDVIASAVISGRAPEIRSATAYVPHGRQSGLRRRLPVLPGLVLDIHEDPVVAVVGRRTKAKADGDLALARELRVLVNSLAFGNLARFDERLHKAGRRWVTGEKPGPLNCLPLASSVTAGSHLLLAVLDRLVRDRGWIVAYRDTDSSIIPASPDGGDLVLCDGSVVHELSHAEVDEVLGAFDALSPAPDWPVWKSERGTPEKPLRALVFGPKRHVEMIGDEIVELTEAGLGGVYADPPAMRGRTAKDYRRWSVAAVRREVELISTREHDPETLRPEAPWDTGSALPFPALQRFEVRHPVQLRSVPTDLGAQPGTRFLRVSGSELAAPGRTFVALDPGGDLADWQRFAWFDTQTGERMRLSTDFADIDSQVVETLDGRAVRYADKPRSEPISEVVVDPDLISHRGRVSGVIDADEEGLGDIGAYRPVHQAADVTAAVVREVRRIGPTAFSDRYDVPLDTAKRISAGRRPSAQLVSHVIGIMRRGVTEAECSLDGCEEPLPARARKFCCPAHAKKSRDRRYRTRTAGAGSIKKSRASQPDPFADLRCPGCGTVVLAGSCPMCPDDGLQAS
jgi:hypothetical protein